MTLLGRTSQSSTLKRYRIVENDSNPGILSLFVVLEDNGFNIPSRKMMKPSSTKQLGTNVVQILPFLSR